MYRLGHYQFLAPGVSPRRPMHPDNEQSPDIRDTIGLEGLIGPAVSNIFNAFTTYKESDNNW